MVYCCGRQGITNGKHALMARHSVGAILPVVGSLPSRALGMTVFRRQHPVAHNFKVCFSADGCFDYGNRHFFCRLQYRQKACLQKFVSGFAAFI
jgi:hypothetical protein